jgi:hypothetical protein
LVKKFGEPTCLPNFSFEKFCEMPVSHLTWIRNQSGVEHFGTVFMDNMQRMSHYQYRDDLLKACLKEFGYWLVAKQ